MNQKNSPVDAIAPAVEHVRRVLFRPFDIGKWFILGFLTFLDLLPQVLNEGRVLYKIPSRNEDWRDSARMMREAGEWISENLTLVSIIAFAVILVALVLFVLFLWLSSRANFCYLDSIANNRAQVVRPWREHGDLADSLFFWRLAFGIAVLFSVTLLLTPALYSLWKMATSGQDFTPWTIVFGSGLVLVSVPVVLIALFAVIVRVLLIDFVAPVQYLRRIPCSAAFRIVWQLIKAHPLAFILYFVLKIVFAILIAIGTVVFFCVTCCIGCCLAAIPVVGQTLLQPIYIFNRSFPLFFLRGYGPSFDVFGPGVLGWSGGPPPSPPPPPEVPPMPTGPEGPGPGPGPIGGPYGPLSSGPYQFPGPQSGAARGSGDPGPAGSSSAFGAPAADSPRPAAAGDPSTSSPSPQPPPTDTGAPASYGPARPGTIEWRPTEVAPAPAEGEQGPGAGGAAGSPDGPEAPPRPDAGPRDGGK